MSGIFKAVTGNGSNTYQNNTAAMTPEEATLVDLNTQLAKRQVQNIDQLEPFQQALLSQALVGLRQQGKLDESFDKFITPDDLATFSQQALKTASGLGADQQALAKQNMELINGGGASPEQLAAIQKAADAAFQSGSSDIDISTQRGIEQVADQLANQRGMRLSDTPIMREATLLARSGADQKASLGKAIAANQANSILQYPLAVSGVNLQQQGVASAATQFQQQLQQQAAQNRLALYGTTANSGIGLAGVGSGAGSSALNALAGVQTANNAGTSFNPASLMTGFGNFVGGAGNLAKGVGGAMLGGFGG